MKTSIKAELILASKNAYTGDILWTFRWVYPRMILAEINTHRMLSRNTSSSRAIPNKKQRSKVLYDPFVPVSIGVNQRGMQAGKELGGLRGTLARAVWRGTRYNALLGSWLLDKLGAHKQISNRLIEPWTWTEQIVTATDLANLFQLRNNDMAEPHFHELAKQTKAIVDGANFEIARQVLDMRTLFEGDWHLPLIREDDIFYNIEDLISNKGNSTEYTSKRVSAARCARVSYYLPTGGRSTVKDDLELCERLTSSGHWSPLEHQATPLKESVYCGNLKGWKQFRKEFPFESGQSKLGGL